MNTIIDKIDLWTTAQELKTSNRGRSASNQSLLGIKKLRELILELAVRGKLVPQDPNDEPASVLLNKIADEKMRLIKKGEIKKQSPLLGIGEDEIPSNIPSQWSYDRLGNILQVINGRAYKIHEMLHEGTPLLRVGNLFTSNEWYYSNLELEPEKYIDNGDLIYSWSASFGPFIWQGGKVIYHYHIWKLDFFEASSFNKMFMYQYLLSITQKIKASGNGIAMIHMTKERMEKLIIPIPPLAEQHRIVAKVDELMTLCDELENQQTNSNIAHETLVATLLGALTDAENSNSFDESWQRIANRFDTLFNTEHSIDQLKKTILQLAVMGKLVPQYPEDEPASELLKKIAKEKARLVKEGKIKKQSALPEISIDEKPFELPKSWVWTRLGSALKKITDGTHFSPPNGEIGEYLYISAKNIKPEGVLLSNATYITKDIHDEIYSRCDPEFGDILYIKDGATTGITTINNLKMPFSMLSSVALLKVPEGILNTYLLLSLTSPYFYKEMRSEMTGVAITRVTLNKLNYAIITLPPLAEQHRIVSKVDELFALCDGLKERLIEAQTLQNQMAVAVVEQGLSIQPKGNVNYTINEQISVAAEP